MYIDLSILFEELSLQYKLIEYKFNQPNHLLLRNIRYLLPNQTIYSGDYVYLYFGTSSLSSMETLPMNVIVVIPQSEYIEFKGFDNNYILIYTNHSHEEVFQRIQCIFDKYVDWNNRLLSCITKESPINALLDTAMEVLYNPIAYFDSTMTLVYQCGSVDNRANNTIWDNVETTGLASTEYYSINEQKELAKLLNNDDVVLFVPEKDPAHEHLVVRLKSKDKFLGTLGMVDIIHDFTDGQLFLLKYLRKVLVDLLQLQHSTMREDPLYYLNQLLNGFYIDQRVVSYQLSKRNWTINGSFYCLIYQYPMENNEIAVRYLKERLKTYFANPILLNYENSIFMIIKSNEYEIIQEHNYRFIELLKKNGFKLGVSTEFYSIMDLKYYYMQCKTALNQGMKNEPQNIIFHFLDYYTNHILNLLSKGTSLKELCHPGLYNLWKEGTYANRELINSLYSYLINGKSIAKSSKNLYIHRNTLSYRLEKVSEILNMNFNELNDEDTFYLILSCKVLFDLDDTV